MPLDSSKFERRIAEAIKHFEQDVPAIAQSAGLAMQRDIAARTPSKEEEYNAMMVGDAAGNTPVPLEGDRSGDTDNRIRFQKEAGSWLQDVAVAPSNISITESEGRTTVRIGNITQLNQASMFRYTNLVDKTIPEEHEAGPYWAYFEYGASYIVLPTHQTNKKYPLRPDETSKVFEMEKSITARRSYAPETLVPLFRDRVVQGLNELNFNS